MTIGHERVLLLLGMHRSGTSVCTRLLNLCGAELSADLLPANASNETGYWEPVSIVTLHERLLAEAGSSWDDPTEFPDAWFSSTTGQGYVAQLTEILRSELPSGLFVVKDPRICRLMPLWRQALAQVARAASMLLVVRHPLEVAASLEQRDGMPTAQALLLWLEHVLAAEASTRGDRRLIVTYDQVLTDWEGVMRRVDDALGIQLPRKGPSVAADVNAFLQPSLRHQRVDRALLDERDDVSEWVRRVYRWHEQASVDPHSVHAAELDDVRRSLRDAAVAYAPLIRWHRQERAALLMARDAQVDAREVEHASSADRESAWQVRERDWLVREEQLAEATQVLARERDEARLAARDLAVRLDAIESSSWWKIRRAIFRK